MTTITEWKPGMVLRTEELTPAIISRIRAALTPAQTMAITAWREAEAHFDKVVKRWVPNPVDAMVDIINVIDNRANDIRWMRRGHKGICLQYVRRGEREIHQFSCWQLDGGPDDPRDSDTIAENTEVVLRIAQQLISGVLPTANLLECLAAAEGCIAHRLIDSLDGACHYYADWIPAPYWAKHPNARVTAVRHGHIFLAGVP